jgi:hypothetical protein
VNPSRRGVLAVLALLLLSNAAVLARVAWNRSGAPEATLTLTERELSFPYRSAFEDEDSGLALHFRVEDGLEVDAAALRRLGFDVSVPLTAPKAGELYRRARSRPAWLVLEQDGSAWQRWRERRKGELAARSLKAYDPDNDYELKSFEQDGRMGSRLMIVAAGRDAAALRRQYPDRHRYAIVPGKVALRFQPEYGDPPDRKPARLYGDAGLSQSDLHVPLSLRPVLDRIAAVPPDPSGEPLAKPRYQATVAFGHRGEPWLVKVERLAP